MKVPIDTWEYYPVTERSLAARMRWLVGNRASLPCGNRDQYSIHDGLCVDPDPGKVGHG